MHPLSARLADVAALCPPGAVVADIGSDARWVRLDLGRGKQAMRHIHWWPLPRHGHAGLLLIDAHPGHHDGATRRAELARGLAGAAPERRQRPF